MKISKIISGGQTGVDRAALDAAISLGLEHGGFCPKGRVAEDGIIPVEYKMDELDTEEYSVRTMKNVQCSDGTLILHQGKITGGTTLTDEFCKLCQTNGFKFKKEFYSNQYYGAIDWITNSDSKFVQTFSDASQAINKKARRKLKRVRMYLTFIQWLRQHAYNFNTLLERKAKLKRHYVLLLMRLPLFIFSNQIDKYWTRKARQEWETKKLKRNGSEMCLFFKRE